MSEISQETTPVTEKQQNKPIIWTDELAEQLRELWRIGLSATLIADELGLGLTRCAILGKARRMDLPMRKRGPRKSVERTMKRAYIIKVAVVPVEPAKPQPIHPPTNIPVPLMMLENHHCRYIVSNGGQSLYCGAPKEMGSFCAYHGEKCYNMEAYRKSYGNGKSPST